MQIIRKNSGFIFFIGVLVIIGFIYFGSPENDFETFVTGSNISDSAEDRDDIEELYRRAREFDADGDFRSAILRYSDIIERNPDDADAYHKRCRAHYRLDQYNPAISDCNKAIELDPTNTHAHAMRCYTYQDMGENEQAIDLCTATLEIDPDYSGVFVARADAYRELGDLDAAIADYDHAIDLNPTSIAYNQRGVLHSLQENYELALADYDQAIKVYDSQVDSRIQVSWSNRGNMNFRLDNYDAAIYDFRKALELDPTHVRSIVRLARTFYVLERYPQALELYETVLRLEENGVSDPNYDTSDVPDWIADIQDNIAAREFVAGDQYDLLTKAREAQIRGIYHDAIESYTAFLQYVDYDVVYYWRGQSYEGTENYIEALADYERYLEKTPNEDGIYEYEVLYRIDELELLLQYDPDAAAKYLEAQAIQYEDPEKALTLYTEAIDIDSTFTEAYQQRASIYHYILIDWEAALADYQAYVGLIGDDEFYESNIAELTAILALPQAAQDCLREINQIYINYEDELISDEMIARYSCVIEAAPNYQPAYTARAELYDYTNYQYAEAAADYEHYLQLVESDPDYDPDALYDRFGTYYDYTHGERITGYIARLETLNRYLELPPETLQLWSDAEYAYYVEYNSENALPFVSEVLDDQPDFTDALSLRGSLYYEQGNFENALIDLKAYIALVGEDASSYEQGLIAEMETFLAYPDDIRALYDEARASAYASPEAIQAYTQVIELYPDFVDAYYQRGLLYQINGDTKLALTDFEMYLSLADEDDPYSESVGYTVDYLRELVSDAEATEEPDSNITD